MARRRNSANDPVPRRALSQIIDPGYSVNCPRLSPPAPRSLWWQVRRRVRAGHDVDCTSVPAWHYLGPTGKLDGGRRCQGSARGPETPGAGYFGLLTRNKPPPDVLISIKTVGEAPMDATYLRALASRCHRSSRDCSDLFAKEELRRLATELEATAQELEGPAKFDAAADAWRRSRPSRGYEGDH